MLRSGSRYWLLRENNSRGKALCPAAGFEGVFHLPLVPKPPAQMKSPDVNGDCFHFAWALGMALAE